MQTGGHDGAAFHSDTLAALPERSALDLSMSKPSMGGDALSERLFAWALAGGEDQYQERLATVLSGTSALEESDDPALARDLLLFRCLRLARRTHRRVH